MKLSEAIRLGAMLKPQTVGSYSDETGSCALGAALDAIGALTEDVEDMESSVMDPWLASLWPVAARRVACPAEGCYHQQRLDDTVIDLNDDHGWTREEIAAWVETVEATMGQTTEEKPVAVRA
jgi:hypothetical protein